MSYFSYPTVLQAQDVWGVKYTNGHIFAVKGSTVNISCTYIYPWYGTVIHKFWFIKERSQNQPCGHLSQPVNKCHLQELMIQATKGKSNGLSDRTFMAKITCAVETVTRFNTSAVNQMTRTGNRVWKFYGIFQLTNGLTCSDDTAQLPNICGAGPDVTIQVSSGQVAGQLSELEKISSWQMISSLSMRKSALGSWSAL
ncbi:hypothetical protein D4764_0222140 [Takifugu flavidus]|uniref:Immunoglobulin V-set domain-containing protein n=1 Tax=Takifugu flavidus TaxID=433684 RepID=A0A5C6MDT2_9TELE|nr:hypothetical protein D4764_0222140 [Takifugu flavidus]